MTVPGWSNLTAPPVTAELWAALRDRIKTSRMASILGGPNRVYVEGDQPPQGEGPETTAWGRAIIVPALPLLDIRFQPGFVTPMDFLLRVEFNDASLPGYNVTLSCELAQQEAFRQWQHWTWAPGGVARSGWPRA